MNKGHNTIDDSSEISTSKRQISFFIGCLLKSISSCNALSSLGITSGSVSVSGSIVVARVLLGLYFILKLP